MKTSSLLKAAAFALMAGSVAMLAKSFASPTEIQDSYMTLVLKDEDFQDARVYLSTRIPLSTNRICIFNPNMDTNFIVYPENDHVFVDTFEGVKLSWIFRQNGGATKVLHYDLTFPKKSKDLVIDSYMPFVSREAASTRLRIQKEFKLYFLDKTENWISLTANHPSTFQNLAIDPQVKTSILHDLDQYLDCRNSRSYLLYGPSGTGKTSLIAAMANYLKLDDVYDLDLTQVSSNARFSMLLKATANSSILVVEDIDCFKNLSVEDSNKTKVTVSGLLDFLDQSWSNKRIIVFTAICKEKLHSELLRPGRIDVQIHMSYCRPSAFEILASNYLNINTHKLFKEIKELILEVEVTPAEVADKLMCVGTVDKVLQGLVEFLRAKKLHKEKAQA